MADVKKNFLLRVDPKLWDELQAWAGQELRSANAQIEYLLKDAVARRRRSREPLPAPDVAGTDADRTPPRPVAPAPRQAKNG